MDLNEDGWRALQLLCECDDIMRNDPSEDDETRASNKVSEAIALALKVVRSN